MATPEEMAMEMAKTAVESVGKESVNKLASVIGGMFPFFGLKHKAVSTYVADIEKSNLSPENKMVAIANAKKTYKQLRNQAAIAEIAQSVAQPGTDFSQQSNVDDEWLERFMDSAKFVSDEEMQLLWGNILAKEFEEPNSTPPRVIRILSEITPSYAKAFQTVCSLNCRFLLKSKTGEISEEERIILPPEYDYLHSFGVDFGVLSELEALGLIQLGAITGYAVTLDSQEYPNFSLYYKDRKLLVTDYPNKEFPIGIVLLTEAGKSISRFASLQSIEGHFEAVCNYLRVTNVKVSEEV